MMLKFMDPPPSQVELGERLCAARTLAGFESMSDVDKSLAWAPRRYETYETGRAKPNYEVLWSLADLFGTSIDELTGHVEDPNEIPLAARLVHAKKKNPKLTDDEEECIEKCTSCSAALTDVLKAIQVLSKVAEDMCSEVA